MNNYPINSINFFGGHFYLNHTLRKKPIFFYSCLDFLNYIRHSILRSPAYYKKAEFSCYLTIDYKCEPYYFSFPDSSDFDFPFDSSSLPIWTDFYVLRKGFYAFWNKLIACCGYDRFKNFFVTQNFTYNNPKEHYRLYPESPFYFDPACPWFVFPEDTSGLSEKNIKQMKEIYYENL
ncbi:hypothetical protein [Dipodfec virus UOA04_Rod_861]|nr:hypothetical protein [Dipodfec virus UOA04_Rod_861]